MPNIKSAKKRVKTNAKKNVINNEKRASARTAVKKLEKTIAAGDKNASKEKLDIAIKNIDKATSSGLIPKNTAARQKSRLTKAHNKME